MKYIISVLLLLALAMHVIAQNRDSLIFVTVNGTSKDKIESYIQLTQIESKTEPKKAGLSAHKAISIAIELGDKELLVEAYYNLARLHAKNQLLDSAKQCFSMALRFWPIGYKIDEKINLINEYYLIYQTEEQNDSAIALIDHYLKTEDNLTDKNRITLLKLISRSYYLLSQFEMALKQMEEAVTLQTAIGDSAGMVDIYNKISTTYRKLGKYEKAVENSQKALELNEKLKNRQGEAESYSTLGGIYYYMNDNAQAIKYFKSALQIFNQLNDPSRIAALNNNIGSVYNEMGQLQDALNYYQKAREQYVILKSDYALAILTDNLGLVYSGLNQNDKALEQFHEALRLFEQVGNRDGYTHCQVNLAGLYHKNGANLLSLETYKKALKNSIELNLGNEQLQIYHEMSALYEQMFKFKEALETYKLYQQTSDTLKSMESMEQLNKMRSQLDLKERENKIILLSKENELANTMVQKQRIVITAGILIAVMIIILLIIVSRALQFSRKAKAKLEEQNKQITLQRNEIQFKNKQLTDSIHYASRVQEAIFVPIPGLKEFVTDYFLISKPQNIVSGDFYWYRYVHNNLYLALADCTGHGVPGALMSMLGNTLLNEIFATDEMPDTHKVLNLLRQKIKASLHQTDLHGNTDGLDISICRIDFSTKQLQFSGAFQPAFIVENNQVIELKADKMPVAVTRSETSFTSQYLAFSKGTRLYFSTDGFYDQFGTNNRGKFTKSRLKTVIEEIKHKDMDQQCIALNEIFNNWKGQEEQTDDVMFLGIEI